MPVFAFLAALILALISAYVYYRQRGQWNAGLPWLYGLLVTTLVAAALFLVPGETTPGLGRSFGLILTLIGMLTALGMLIIGDSVHRLPRVRLRSAWLGANGVWAGLVVAGAFLAQTAGVGRMGWLESALTAPDVATILAVTGLIVSGTFLLIIGFYDFYRALMPEVANRALYWVATTAAALITIVLLASGLEALHFIGIVALPLVAAAAAYAHLHHRVLDVRSAALATAHHLVLIAITALIAFIGLILASHLGLEPSIEATLVLMVVALLVATVHIPARQLVEAALKWLAARRTVDPTNVTRQYSLLISQAVDLNALVGTATETLNRALRVRRSALLMISRTSEDSIELSQITDRKEANREPFKGPIPKASPTYQALAADHLPILQFDLEYSPGFQQITPEERSFWRALQMSAYAPILVENAFIGVLACGPKQDDAPFTPNDLQLLATLAQQTGVALRNSRLIADLRHLNDTMRTLNKGLESAKEELQKLDSVKTDFITIASHELRTPLAQIRGYTDIIEALNEQGILDQEQLKTMTANLRKATERTEELISAMLDVSQLDVNAMDLSFAQTTLESVIRLAVEPLTDVIRQRKLTLAARGLRGLPPVQADMQRLVQALRNVIVNAIKFTPDGGKIDIAATLQNADSTSGRDNILLSIRDTGVGIAKENLELIFQKFYRTYDPSLHSTGAYKFQGAGPGLGLTIAKGVISGHGGKIWAESAGYDERACPGTTFYIALPVSPPEDARRVLPFEEVQAASG